jgi:predicted DNA-binding antitoxin AbrB/MazE fold protein
MPNVNSGNDTSADKPAVTLPGTVEKILPSVGPREPEKAQIAIHGAEPLYRELRIENSLKDQSGHKVKLKEGAEVDVTIEATADGIVPAGRP